MRCQLFEKDDLAFAPQQLRQCAVPKAETTVTVPEGGDEILVLDRVQRSGSGRAAICSSSGRASTSPSQSRQLYGL